MNIHIAPVCSLSKRSSSLKYHISKCSVINASIMERWKWRTPAGVNRERYNQDGKSEEVIDWLAKSKTTEPAMEDVSF